METFEIESVSILKEFYLAFLGAGKTFRNRVCKELDYNHSLFYKRMNEPKHTDLSIADRERIIHEAETIVKGISYLIKVQKDALNPPKGILKVDK